MKVRDIDHPLLPPLTAEDRSRQRMVVALKRTINGRLRPRNIALYHAHGEPAFVDRHGRRPESRSDMLEAFSAAPRYRIWSALNRTAQEMIWLAAGEPLVRDDARRADVADTLPLLGSLTLDPAFDPPAEIADIDIHLQPGGYALDRGDGDTLAGALYEAGGNIFAFGQGVGRNDSKAGAVIRHLEASFPDFRPRRILDLGCSAGAATCAWAAHYPDAEVHGLDIGTGMLRYAHHRARALGVVVHFHQGDAARMPKFEDDSFDLVVSHNLLHEIGSDQRRAMMAEAFRVTRPGGLVLHQDVSTRFVDDDVARVERAWDTRYNGEAFWDIYAADDLVADMRAAGFPDHAIREQRLGQVDGVAGWYLLEGRVGA